MHLWLNAVFYKGFMRVIQMLKRRHIMKAKRTFKQRVISGFIAIAMIFTIIPFSLLTALAANGDTDRVADPSTMDDWKNYFPSC